MMNCAKCDNLMELFENTDKSERSYWLMTEIFVELHGGKDYCYKENRAECINQKRENE